MALQKNVPRHRPEKKSEKYKNIVLEKPSEISRHDYSADFPSSSNNLASVIMYDSMQASNTPPARDLSYHHHEIPLVAPRRLYSIFLFYIPTGL